MNAANLPNSNGKLENLPVWADCEVFCIHQYAADPSAACGWRGLLKQASRDPTSSTLLCPRCGCATIFHIPSNRAH